VNRVLVAPSNYSQAIEVLADSGAHYSSTVQRMSLPNPEVDPLRQLERTEYLIYGLAADKAVRGLLLKAPNYLMEDVWYTEAVVASALAGLRTNPYPTVSKLIDGVLSWCCHTPHWQRPRHRHQPYRPEIGWAANFCAALELASYTPESQIPTIVADTLVWYGAAGTADLSQPTGTVCSR
jgi:hypothetical protein